MKKILFLFFILIMISCNNATDQQTIQQKVVEKYSGKGDIYQVEKYKFVVIGEDGVLLIECMNLTNPDISKEIYIYKLSR